MLQNYKNVELVKPSGLDLKDRLVGVQRVTKVTKGGRAFGFSAIVVVGDENGVVGQGLGKSKEVAEAISKAVEDAKKNLVRIPIAKGTVPHEQKGKFGGARVFLKPASQGTGVIAGGAVRSVLEAVGVHNVLSKSQGSSNPHNVVKASIDALLSQASPKLLSAMRGKKISEIVSKRENTK
jgi:small subunit ribosomal protein S5